MIRFGPSVVACLAILGTLSLKGETSRRPADGSEDRTIAVTQLLASRGFRVAQADANTAPAWTTGERGLCSIRIAAVADQGWYRDIVAQQAAGSQLRYAFDGRLYREQPVGRTTVSFYWVRLRNYFGFETSAPTTRAIIYSNGCGSDGLLSDIASLT